LTLTLLPALHAAAEDLTTLPISELMDLEVSSAARRTRTVAETSAAIYVIGADDILRSPATTVPDLLRSVPGLMVAQIDASKWAISSRSFNSLFADKLLVLVDGRSTYSPLFSSTDWTTIAPPLDEIERIEVIRGPGATLWGANAVNGVINIITKKTRVTPGVQASLAGGNALREQAYLRYGASLGDNGSWRVQFAQREQGPNGSTSAAQAADDWRIWQGRTRFDVVPDSRTHLTFDGEFYQGEAGFVAREVTAVAPWLRTSDDDRRLNGGHLLGRWERKWSDAAQLTLQTYYDHTLRDDFLLKETRDTFDIDLQNDLHLFDRHQFLWGGGYRYSRSDLDSSFTVAFAPENQIDHSGNIFFQDDWTLIEDLAVMTIGSRFERTSYTPFEWEPNLRLLVTPTPDLSFWAAVSRAVRTPGRFDREIQQYAPFRTEPALLLGQVHGREDFVSEKVWAFELGNRTRLPAAIELDVAVFYNRYSDLRSFSIYPTQIDPAFTPPQPVVHGETGNDLEGESHGAEVALSSDPRDDVQLKLSYTYFRLFVRNRSNPNDPFAKVEGGKSPRHQAALQCRYDLSRASDTLLTLRYVGHLDRGEIPAYLELDVRMNWQFRPGWTVSLAGENLLDHHHREFAQESLTSVVPTEAARSVWAKLNWAF
jgi:iron complex outermembrane receptor protein